MRRIRHVLLVLCCFTLAVVTLRVSGEEAKLRFVTLEFSPFVYIDNGIVSGPGADVITAVCGHMNVTCVYELYPWRRAQKLVKEGKAVGMMVVGRNKRREEWVRFSPPVFQTEYGFFVAAGNPISYSDSGDLEGFKVGVFAPSNTATNLRAIQTGMTEGGLNPIEIEDRPDDESGFKKLALGRLDAVYSNRDRGNEIIRKLGLESAVRYAGAEKQLFYYVGFSKQWGDHELLDRFDEAYLALYEKGVIKAILDRHHLHAADLK